MAISYDARTLAAANYTATGTQNTTHAVGANARAAVVIITQIATSTDQVSGVTFNGVTMNRPTAYRTNTDEAGCSYIYFLDGITGQGGNVTVAMTTTGSSAKRLSVHTFNTAASNISVDCTANSAFNTTANPTVTISGLDSGKTYLGVMGVHSSLNAFPNTPGSGWTSNHFADEGTEGVGHAYLTNTTTGVTSLTPVWTAGADGYAIVAAALTEGAAFQESTASTAADSTEASTGATTKPVTAGPVDIPHTVAAAPAAMTKSTTSSVTPSYVVASSGLVTDTGSASVTVSPAVASSGLVTDIAGALLTLFPQFNIHYATAGNSSKSVTATVTAGITPATSGSSSKPSTASVSMPHTVAAAGAMTKPVTAASGASYTVAASADITKAATFELWENGSFVASLGTQNVSISGSVFEFDITPYVTSLADQTGANVELRMTASSASIRVDAVEWEGWAETLGFVTHEGDAALTVAPTPAAAGRDTNYASALTPTNLDNLVPNPSFEAEDLSPWISSGTPVLTRQADSVFGSSSLLVTATDTSGYPHAQHAHGGYTTYFSPATPGQTYNFSGYIKNVNGDARFIYYAIQFFDASYAFIGGSEFDAGQVVATTDGWVKVTTTPVAPALSAYVRVVAVGGTTTMAAGWQAGFDGLLLLVSGKPEAFYVSPTPAAASTANKPVTASVTVSPVTAATLSAITDTGSASLTVDDTVAASGATSKPVTATTTTSPTPAASGTVTDTGSASFTVAPAPVTSGFVTDYGTASLVVDPIPAATPAAITDTGSAATTATYTVAASGFVTDYGTSSLTVDPIPASTGGAITDTGTAATTAAYTVAASGLVTDTASASLTTNPAPVATGLVTDYGTASLTVDPTPAAEGVTTMIWEGQAYVTLDPTPAASGTSSKPITAATTTSPIPAASANQVLYSTAAVTTSPQVAAAGTATKPVTAATSSSPTVAAAGFDTQYGTASVTTSPAVAATLSEITDTGSASLTVQYAVAATLSPITDTATAATTVTYTVAAAGLVTDSASASLTVDTTQTASGTSSKPVTAATSTAPIPAASATQTQYATAALTSDPAVTTSGASSKPLVAGTTTVDPIPAAAGLVTSTRTASVTVDPIPAASGTVLKTVTAAVTVLPTVTAASGGLDKPGTAALTAQITPAATAGGSSKSVEAGTTLVDPQPWAEGIVWRSMFLRPDALLSMSGLTGSYTDIQDSPTSPDANKLTPTGGAIDVRMSFEDDGQILREETGDQILRILMTVPS